MRKINFVIALRLIVCLVQFVQASVEETVKERERARAYTGKFGSIDHLIPWRIGSSPLLVVNY